MAESENAKNLKIITKIDECSPSNCFSDQDSDSNDFSKCRRCQRHVHYVCSELLLIKLRCVWLDCESTSRSLKNIGEREETRRRRKIKKAIEEIEDEINKRVGSIEIKLDKILANIK